MFASRRLVALGLFAVTLIAAYVLKLHYSSASADGLRWILAPTTTLVELATGRDFAWEAGAGYENRDLMFVIAPSCAGVNFLIAAFVMLVFTMVRLARAASDNVRLAALAAVGALGATVLVNATRIVVALGLHGASWGWLTAARVHVLLGVVVYLAALVGLHALARRLTGRGWAGVRQPLFWYLAITVAVPLLNGAAGRPGFWGHTLLVVAAAAALAAAVSSITSRRRRAPARASV